VGGCQKAAEQEQFEPLAADFLQVTTPKRSVKLDGATQVPDAQALLISPHVAVAFAWTAVVKEINGKTAAGLALNGAVRAAADHELVVVALDDEEPVAPYKDKNAKPELTVSDRALPGVPKAADVIIVSVPVGGSAVLKVTDAERTFSYDLRAGKRGDDAVAAYYRSGRSANVAGEYKQTGRVSYRTDGRDLSVTMYPRRFSVEPWLPSKGWAKPDRMWLLLGTVDLNTDALSYDVTKREFAVKFQLDLAKSFALALPDGQQIRPASALVNVSGPATSFTVPFDVPASFQRGTITFTPDGSMLAIYNNAEPSIGWAKRPASGQFPLALPGA
jgi:hypothetical protein